MMNFECIDGPYAGLRFPVKGEPEEGLLRSVYILDGDKQREAFYELRRHETVELITDAGVWQWYFIDPMGDVKRAMNRIKHAIGFDNDRIGGSI